MKDDIHHYHAPLEILASVQSVFYHHPGIVFKEWTVQNNESFAQSKSRSPRTKTGKLERKVIRYIPDLQGTGNQQGRAPSRYPPHQSHRPE